MQDVLVCCMASRQAQLPGLHFQACVQPAAKKDACVVRPAHTAPQALTATQGHSRWTCALAASHAAWPSCAGPSVRHMVGRIGLGEVAST